MTREALRYHIYGYGWRYGIISTVMVGVMVSYLRLWLALWYHIYGYGWRYGIISTVMVGVMVSYLRLVLWYHINGWCYDIISTVGVMVSYLRLVLWYHIYGWRYGIISTVPYEQQNIQTNNLISENILSFHQFNRPPMSSWTVNCFDVYDPCNKRVYSWLHLVFKWKTVDALKDICKILFQMTSKYNL